MSSSSSSSSAQADPTSNAAPSTSSSHHDPSLASSSKSSSSSSREASSKSSYLSRPSVAVVVLGDLGRSPRMQFHTLSLASHKFQVNFVGYEGSDPPEAITSHPLINLRYLRPPPKFPGEQMPLARLFFILFYAPLRIAYQLLQLLFMMLVIIPPQKFILLQNPPAIPSLLIFQFVAWMTGAKLIIDWHNLGYSILALRLGFKHPIVRLAEAYERYFGANAYAHFTVTKAMSEELYRRWNLSSKPIVLYDRSPERFCQLELPEAHELYKRLQSSDEKIFREFSAHTFSRNDDIKGTGKLKKHGDIAEETLFTQKFHDGSIQFKKERPALIISSTSWTADEDFQMLLDAIILYERRAEKLHQEGKSAPCLLFLITGKGPERKYYEDKIDQMRLHYTRIGTMWLKAEDYPLLLGSADLGICLHTSSSGLDLPMKVVDMFGCGLPVCAVDYRTLGELVQDKENGLTFTSSKELFDQLVMLFGNFPENSKELEKLRKGALKFQSLRWEENWDKHAWPVFQSHK